MKKLYILLITIFTTTLGFGQTPIITAIIDGDCPLGTPKVLEIYAQGTVNFADYSLENQANANTTWGNTTALTTLGSITDGFVYIVASTAELPTFNTEFPSATTNVLVGSVMSLNGDDRIRIIKNSDSSVIDQYGVTNEDGSGKPWEYADSYAKRKNNTSPNGSFTIADWTIPGAVSLDGGGSCQGGSTFEVMMGGIGTFTASTASVVENQIAGFSMYPNPVANGRFSITSNSNAPKQVEIYSMIGQQVYSKMVQPKELIEVSNLNKGVYMISVVEEGKTATRKLVIN